jgi:hypothetical protein
MTTTEPTPIELGDKPSERQANAQYAHAREEARRGGGHASVAVATAAVPKILAGASPFFEQPASIAALWDLHCRSAQYFEFGPWKALRYGWGCLHIVIASGCYLLAWSTRSFPAGIVLAGLVIAAVVLL